MNFPGSARQERGRDRHAVRLDIEIDGQHALHGVGLFLRVDQPLGAFEDAIPLGVVTPEDGLVREAQGFGGGGWVAHLAFCARVADALI